MLKKTLAGGVFRGREGLGVATSYACCRNNPTTSQSNAKGSKNLAAVPLEYVNYSSCL